MQVPRALSKILTHRYTLYAMVFLSATNVLGYLVSQNYTAVVFFALVCLLAHQFSKNMAVVLLAGLVASSWLVLFGRGWLREGMESADGSGALEKAMANDPQIADAVSKVKQAKSKADLDATTKPAAPKTETNKQKTAEAAARLEDDADGPDADLVDANNADLNRRPKDLQEPMGAGSSGTTNKRRAKTEEHFGPRLDYASTIEQSYQNLDKMLGSDSIQRLTQDTQKLMAQQQNLFNTMTQMVPVLEGAQKMLDKFDMNSLTQSFDQIKGLAGVKG